MSAGQIRGRSRGTRTGGSSYLLCDKPVAGPAMLVRGSSRRMTTMTASPQNSIREYQLDQPSMKPARPSPGLPRNHAPRPG
jgi:hypothetical protein